jgi:hypothetical protein
MIYAEVCDRELAEKGWSCVDLGICDIDDLSKHVRKVAGELGEVVKGRRGAEVERLESVPTAEAYSSSLSATYGEREFPPHMDTAHLPVPCRYLVIGCAAASYGTAATLLLDTANVSFTAQELKSLQTGIFLVKNGGHSFFAPLLNNDRKFFRWDPGCMMAKDEIAKVAMSVFQEKVGSVKPIRHAWHSGSILVLDNWRMLHGRERCDREDARRTLLRSSVL